MIKRFYVLVWFVLAVSIVVSVFTGSLTNVGLLGHALVALALVYGLALWSVFRTGPPRTQ